MGIYFENSQLPTFSSSGAELALFQLFAGRLIKSGDKKQDNRSRPSNRWSACHIARMEHRQYWSRW